MVNVKNEQIITGTFLHIQVKVLIRNKTAELFVMCSTE